jgi:hypothetical protein
MPKQTWVSPHVLAPNDRVYQRYSPWNTGTVSKVVKGHTFTVVYDDPGRKPGQPRQRYTYPASLQRNFLVGNPPDSGVPAPVHVDEN